MSRKRNIPGLAPRLILHIHRMQALGRSRDRVLCAVVMAAHNASRWIDAALESIEAQESCDGWKYETRIAVDACDETSRHLHARGTPHFWSPVNVGPYLLRNALMRKPADAYAVFDADDVMGEAYLRTLLPLMGDGIAGSGRVGIDKNGRPGTNVYPYVMGVSVFSPVALKKLGGYRPWRICADFDMILRAGKLKIPLAKHEDALFFRRDHPGQLTKHPETGIGSAERKALKAESRRLIKAGERHVKPVCAELVWRPVPVEVAA